MKLVQRVFNTVKEAHTRGIERARSAREDFNRSIRFLSRDEMLIGAGTIAGYGAGTVATAYVQGACEPLGENLSAYCNKKR